MKKTMLSVLLMFILMSIHLQAQNTSNKTFHEQVKKEVEVSYTLYQPAKNAANKPLIIFLHGAGERGNDLEKLKVHGPLKYVKNNPLDAYILAPQCPEGKLWDSEKLYHLIQEIVSTYRIDANRIYLTGLSMGGWGTWNLATTYPDLFAAIVPICGMVDRTALFNADGIKNTPIRIYHGALDDVVQPEESLKMYQHLKKLGAKNTAITIFPEANHDSWTQVYDNQEIYKWMLDQKKK